MIKCVISDLGKVIVSFDNRIYFEKIAGYSPYSAQEIASMALKDLDVLLSFERGKISPDEFYQKVVRILEARIDYQTFYPIYCDVFALDPNILNIIRSLRPRYKLVLLSNTDVMRFGFIKRRFPEILVFDEYVLSYQIGFVKPHPRMYREAVKRAAKKPEECLFIDDSGENIAAARELGIHAVPFGPQTDLEAELRKHGLHF